MQATDHPHSRPASENGLSAEPYQAAVPAGSVQAYRDSHASERLSLSPFARITLATGGASFVGFMLGSSYGSQTAGLRFRAENSHRLPKSDKQWYFYHKSKNYHMALGGVKEGLKMGFRTGFWVALFVATEDAVDVMRDTLASGRDSLVGSRDVGSTVVAGLGTAGAFSLWNRFPVATAARTARLGLAVGLTYGAVQDAVSLLRGRRLGYVETAKRLLQRWWST